MDLTEMVETFWNNESSEIDLEVIYNKEETRKVINDVIGILSPNRKRINQISVIYYITELKDLLERDPNNIEIFNTTAGPSTSYDTVPQVITLLKNYAIKEGEIYGEISRTSVKCLRQLARGCRRRRQLAYDCKLLNLFIKLLNSNDLTKIEKSLRGLTDLTMGRIVWKELLIKEKVVERLIEIMFIIDNNTTIAVLHLIMAIMVTENRQLPNTILRKMLECTLYAFNREDEIIFDSLNCMLFLANYSSEIFNDNSYITRLIQALNTNNPSILILIITLFSILYTKNNHLRKKIMKKNLFVRLTNLVIEDNTKIQKYIIQLSIIFCLWTNNGIEWMIRSNLLEFILLYSLTKEELYNGLVKLLKTFVSQADQWQIEKISSSPIYRETLEKLEMATADRLKLKLFSIKQNVIIKTKKYKVEDIFQLEKLKNELKHTSVDNFEEIITVPNYLSGLGNLPIEVLHIILDYVMANQSLSKTCQMRRVNKVWNYLITGHLNKVKS